MKGGLGTSTEHPMSRKSLRGSIETLAACQGHRRAGGVGEKRKGEMWEAGRKPGQQRKAGVQRRQPNGARRRCAASQ